MIKNTNLELGKAHPDNSFNQNKNIQGLDDTTKKLKSKMMDIKKMYLDLKNEDEFEPIEN